jgi:hypothetical protein
MNPKTLFIAYKLARKSQSYYGVGMKFVERIKSRIRLVISLIALYALIILGLLVYIAIRVS